MVTQEIIEGATSNYSLTFNTYDGVSAMSTNLFLESGGNVGIGTDAPEGLLHLYKSSGYAQLRVETDDTTNSLGFSEIYLDADTSSDNQVWRIQGLGGSHSTDARKLKFYDGTAGATRMVIDSSGKVGIGTDDPGSKLNSRSSRRSRSGNRFKSYSFENRNTR